MNAKASSAETQGHALVEELSRRYGAVLMRYFLRRRFDAADAQDLSQEVFLRLSRNGALDHVDRAEAYLFTMAANLVAEHHRRQSVRRSYVTHSLAAQGDASDQLSPERVMNSRQELELIVTTLNEMPERMRTIFILARLENLPRSEIAARMGVSKRTVEGEIATATAWLADRRSRIS